MFTLLTLQFANAQQTESYTSLDIVRLVTDANFKLNTIYRNRVTGQEQEQASLQKAIYAANGELMDIRGMLTGGNRINEDKMISIQKQATKLQESITAVNETLSDADIQKAIDKVKAMLLP